jgi:toxin ParE1/3/4
MDIADRFIELISERFFLLASHPFAGRVREDLRPGLSSFPIGQYVILHRIEDGDVLILHVVHGRRDIEILFGH